MPRPYGSPRGAVVSYKRGTPLGGYQGAVASRGPELVKVAPDVLVLLRSRDHYHKIGIYQMFIVRQSPIITFPFMGSWNILEFQEWYQGAVASRGPEPVKVAPDVLVRVLLVLRVHHVFRERRQPP